MQLNKKDKRTLNNEQIKFILHKYRELFKALEEYDKTGELPNILNKS